MEESKYTKTVYNLFKNEFYDGWIDELPWKGTDEDKVILVQGVEKINVFFNRLFVEYGKLVLSGDQLKSKTELLGAISDNLISDVVPKEEFSFRNKLLGIFSNLQTDIIIVDHIIKKYCSITRKKFEHNYTDYVFDDIQYKGLYKSHDSRIELLNLICNVTLNEYSFLFDEQYIKKIYLQYIDLKAYFRKYSQSKDIRVIILSAIEKVVFLLEKLSYFSDKKG